MMRKVPNRRRAERVRLAKPLIARLGTIGVVLIDISPFGARIEHYSRFDRGAERILRIQWGAEAGTIRCQIVSCKVHRFAPGDDGLTVYQSGLVFTEDDSASELVKKLISAHLAGTLVEQVANARGFAPPNVENMPIFRGGVLTNTDGDVQAASSDKHLLPEKKLVHEVGYICFALVKGRWTRKWTLDPEQPREGFTVSANEPLHQIDLLAEQYMNSRIDEREFIRTLARLSVEGGGRPEPQVDKQQPKPAPKPAPRPRKFSLAAIADAVVRRPR